MFDWLRRSLAMARPLPGEWQELLRRRVPFYGQFDPAERERFEEKLKAFLATKTFVGAGGLEITDEVRLLVAAGAARMTMNMPDQWFGRLHEIVVYPNARLVPHTERGDPVRGKEQPVIGLATPWNVVVLAWDAV